MKTVVKNITQKEQKLAQSSLQNFLTSTRNLLKKNGKAVRIKFQDNGETVIIPEKAFLLLSGILQNMAAGKSVALVSPESQLSTQQAADLLNVSRPQIVKLLEAGEITFEKVGTHRRVALQDVLDYKEKRQKQRKEKLRFLTQQAQELQMGY